MSLHHPKASTKFFSFQGNLETLFWYGKNHPVSHSLRDFKGKLSFGIVATISPAPLFIVHSSESFSTNQHTRHYATSLQKAIRCPPSSENYAVVQKINKSTAEISFSDFAHTLWELREGVFESDLVLETFSRGSEILLEFLPSRA